MLTGGVAYRQKPSLFMTVTPRRDKKNRFSSVNFIPDIHFQNLVPDTALLLPDYGINVMPPLCMRHSGKIVAKLIVNDDIFPDGFTTTVICSDQNLNQNELQQ